MKRSTKETCTSKVLRVLVAADDFRTGAQLCEELPEEPRTRVSAALCHLFGRKAINYIESDNTLWWYPTPETDNRREIQSERVEVEARKKRKSGYHQGKPAKPRQRLKGDSK